MPIRMPRRRRHLNRHLNVDIVRFKHQEVSTYDNNTIYESIIHIRIRITVPCIVYHIIESGNECTRFNLTSGMNQHHVCNQHTSDDFLDAH